MLRKDLLERARTYIEEETEAAFRREVEDLLAREDWKELEDRFYRDLEFGTGGLRGRIGGGTNRMNLLVVRKATQGLCDYLKSALPGKRLSACVAFDSRRYSVAFAEATALVFAANGIKAWLFSALRPTPELSFAIRNLKADTGIVVTASHNPPAYNGYKAYWGDGAQVIAPHDEGIIARVNSVGTVRTMGRAEASASGMLAVVDREIDEPYVAMVKSKLFRPDLIKRMAGSVKIVYTPLHGTGALHFERVMGDLGLSVATVPEQREPDGEFPDRGLSQPRGGCRPEDGPGPGPQAQGGRRHGHGSRRRPSGYRGAGRPGRFHADHGEPAGRAPCRLHTPFAKGGRDPSGQARYRQEHRYHRTPGPDRGALRRDLLRLPHGIQVDRGPHASLRVGRQGLRIRLRHGGKLRLPRGERGAGQGRHLRRRDDGRDDPILEKRR